jgi:ribonuclease P protein component
MVATGTGCRPEPFRTYTSSGIAMNTSPQPDQRQSFRRSLTGARLRKHADYQRAYAASCKRQSASMSWFLAPQPSVIETAAGPRVGLTAGKVLGKAHERNRIKRRMREALRRHVDLLPPGCDLILHPRRAVLTVDFRKLEAEVVRILQQAKTEAARMKPPTPPQAAGTTP